MRTGLLQGMKVGRFSDATLQNIAFLLAAVIVLANTVSATYGLDNINLIQAFNLDEARYVAKMKVSLQQATLESNEIWRSTKPTNGVSIVQPKWPSSAIQ